MTVQAYILIQTEVGKAANVASQIAGIDGRHARRGRHRTVRRDRPRRGEHRRRARQARRRAGAERARDHPHPHLPGRAPLTRRTRRLVAAALVAAARPPSPPASRRRSRCRPPEPKATAADACRSLVAALPDVARRCRRRAVEPDSDLTAAWGDPPIVLRCGVDRPAAYEPTSLLGTYDDVDWLPVEADDGYVFYATGRVAWVEVAVPSAYAPESNPLIDLAAAVSANVPVLAALSARSVADPLVVRCDRERRGERAKRRNRRPPTRHRRTRAGARRASWAIASRPSVRQSASPAHRERDHGEADEQDDRGLGPTAPHRPRRPRRLEPVGDRASASPAVTMPSQAPTTRNAATTSLGRCQPAASVATPVSAARSATPKSAVGPAQPDRNHEHECDCQRCGDGRMAAGQRVERERVDPDVGAVEHAVLQELRRGVGPAHEHDDGEREVDCGGGRTRSPPPPRWRRPTRPRRRARARSARRRSGGRGRSGLPGTRSRRPAAPPPRTGTP